MPTADVPAVLARCAAFFAIGIPMQLEPVANKDLPALAVRNFVRL